MNIDDFYASLQSAFAPQLLSIFGALAILVVGWLVAVIVRAGVRHGLGMLRLDERVKASVGESIPIEKPIALAFFWLIILITVVGVFSALNLTDVSAPIQMMVTQIIAYLPKLIAAALLLAVAWLSATLVRALSARVLGATKLDERLSTVAGMAPMSSNAASALFWLVILMFLPAIAGTLGIAGLVGPLEGMTSELIGMIPNILAALVIAGVGWLLAHILGGLVTAATSAMGIDRRAASLGVAEGQSLSRAAGRIVFVLILVPAAVAALDALQVKAISEPATMMLGQFLAAIPNIVAAIIILAIAWVLARLVADLATRLSAAAGVDSWPAKLGISAEVPADARPSKLLGSLILFFIMLFAATEAANRLALGRLADLLAKFIQFAGDILLGAIILVVGWWLAGLAFSAIRQTSEKHGMPLAQIARFAIIGLVFAMGLRAMGIADDIVNLGFGLTLGAVAAAVALAFGLGGREAASKLLERWLGRIER